MRVLLSLQVVKPLLPHACRSSCGDAAAPRTASESSSTTSLGVAAAGRRDPAAGSTCFSASASVASIASSVTCICCSRAASTALSAFSWSTISACDSVDRLRGHHALHEVGGRLGVENDLELGVATGLVLVPDDASDQTSLIARYDSSAASISACTFSCCARSWRSFCRISARWSRARRSSSSLACVVRVRVAAGSCDCAWCEIAPRFLQPI